ncbi:WAT1-related protein [Senna tora]|uniref:WAT1-related protein n=1 Tax=Senna tora TaxID=362788 RepID=A0A834TDT3_9FABA|nr:WAT1-related protein [Senna tora]
MGSVLTEKMKLLVALLALQFCFAGFHIVSRLALNMGVSQIVYPVYRNLIALLLLTPLAYFLEKNQRPPLTFSLLVEFFLLALLGITANQGFYLLGLYYASPTFASAMQNSVPAITFVMASALRLEELNIARRDGLAKVLGTIASVGGASVITLYKGPPLLHQTQQIEGDTLQADESSIKMQNWTWGCIYLLGHCLSWAGWMVFQAPVVKKYPAKLTLTSFTCFFGLIQFLIIAAFAETDLEHWKIKSAEELFTILYAHLVLSSLSKHGAFKKVVPCLLLIVGAILIVIGLYLVLWGKTNENRVAIQEEASLIKPLLNEEENKKAEATAQDIP